ncbi:MAG: phosphatase [Rhodobiaceae bacterium]|nr:phosphatase [Rhodobiaceae bacterium]
MKLIIALVTVIFSFSVNAKTIEKIALGSCLHQDRSQPIWEAILYEKSDIFIFMGDNVYGDDKKTGKLEKLKKTYDLQKNRIPFNELRETNEITAIWDDHDYGINDGGASFPYKEDAEKLFFDFWEIPKGHEQRSHPGLYFEIKRELENGTLQIIFLDTRYFKSDFIPTDQKDAPLKERYINDFDPSKTILGKKQWKWFSEKLKEKVDVKIIVSSIQIIAEGHGYEKWGLLPLEKERFYDLIDNNSSNNIIIISGDRHAGGIYKDTTKAGLNIYELTSSSLNLPVGGWIGLEESNEEPGPKRIGALYLMENYGLIEFNSNNKVFLSLKDITGKTVNKIEFNY